MSIKLINESGYTINLLFENENITVIKDKNTWDLNLNQYNQIYFFDTLLINLQKIQDIKMLNFHNDYLTFNRNGTTYGTEYFEPKDGNRNKKKRQIDNTGYLDFKLIYKKENEYYCKIM